MDQRPGVVFQHSQERVKQEGDDRRGKKTACVYDNFFFYQGFSETSKWSPNSIVRIYRKKGCTELSNGND